MLQVSFDRVSPSHDEDERDTPYVLIGRNFEFPDSATVEWHDGQDYYGGAEITSMCLQRNRVSIKLDRDLELDVTFRVSDKKFAKLKSFLRRMIDDRVDITK